MYDKNRWKETKYKKLVRMTEEDYEFLKLNKGKKSIAGKLREIIKKYKN